MFICLLSWLRTVNGVTTQDDDADIGDDDDDGYISAKGGD